MEFVFENKKSSSTTSDQGFGAKPNDGFNQSLNLFDEPTQSITKPARRAARRSVATNIADVEFNDAPRSRKRTAGPKVNYVKPMKKKSRSRTQKFEWTWGKFCWLMCAFLVLRLVVMENGIIDYYSMKETLIKKEYNLQMLRQDNVNLMGEIHKIRTSPRHQKKIARDHLGVIARGEYLVLFSSDRPQY